MEEDEDELVETENQVSTYSVVLFMCLTHIVAAAFIWRVVSILL